MIKMEIQLSLNKTNLMHKMVIHIKSLLILNLNNSYQMIQLRKEFWILLCLLQVWLLEVQPWVWQIRFWLEDLSMTLQTPLVMSKSLDQVQLLKWFNLEITMVLIKIWQKLQVWITRALIFFLQEI